MFIERHILFRHCSNILNMIGHLNQHPFVNICASKQVRKAAGARLEIV